MRESCTYGHRDLRHVTATTSGLGGCLADNLELPQHSKGEHINTRAIPSHPHSSPATLPSLLPHNAEALPHKNTHPHIFSNHG